MKYRKVTACQVYEKGLFEPVLVIFARGEDVKRVKIKKYGMPSYFFTAEEPEIPVAEQELLGGGAVPPQGPPPGIAQLLGGLGG